MSILKKNQEYVHHIEGTVKHASKELKAGLKLLNRIDKKVITIFGSHVVDEHNNDYKHCREVAYKLGKMGYAIMSGGGPGIMEAANIGAMRAGATSIGVQAKLLKNESVSSKIFTDRISFRFLFVRRFILSIKSEAMIFYPGGLGTLNELFEFATLIQTSMADKVPMICVNRKYWKGLFKWMDKSNGMKNLFHGTTKKLGLVQFADNFEEILAIIEDKSS